MNTGFEKLWAWPAFIGSGPGPGGAVPERQQTFFHTPLGLWHFPAGMGRTRPYAGGNWPARDLYAIVRWCRKLAGRVKQTAALQPHQHGVARILLYLHTGFSYGWIRF